MTRPARRYRSMYALIDRFVRERQPPFAESTRGTYRTVLAAFIRRNKVQHLAQLEPGLLKKWVFDDAVAPRTQGVRRAAMSSWCRWMVDEGVLRDNPLARVPVPKTPATNPRALTHDEAAQVMAAARDRSVEDELIFSLMLQEGLRSGEVRAVTLNDVDFGRRTLLVHGKGDKERLLPLSEQTIDVLRRYLAVEGWVRGRLIRTRRTRQPISRQAFTARTRDVFVASGVKEAAYDGKSAHAARHTFATDVYETSGFDVRVVQQALGHESLHTTQAYLRKVSVRELAEAMAGRRY